MSHLLTGHRDEDGWGILITGMKMRIMTDDEDKNSLHTQAPPLTHRHPPQEEAEVEVPPMVQLPVLVLADDGGAESEDLIEDVVQGDLRRWQPRRTADALYFLMVRGRQGRGELKGRGEGGGGRSEAEIIVLEFSV